MHIVHVGVKYEAETTVGSVRAASSYARYQAELGHRVTMVQLSPSGGSGRWTEPTTGIEEVVLPVPRLSTALGSETTAVFAANRIGGDLYHFHTSYARHCLAARRLPVPYVDSPHGAYLAQALGERRLWKLAFRRLLGATHLRHAAFVHAITPTERASILAFAGDCRVEVVPNPVLPRPLPSLDERRAARAALGLAEDDLLLLFLGRLDVFGKGLDLLVEAFRIARARAAGQRLRLVMAGPPWPGPRPERLIDPALRDAVEVREPVLGAEKQALLAAADLFVTLSRWDVMPTAVLDALAAGLPLLVSEESGFGDFLRANPSAGSVLAVDADAVAVADAIRGAAPAAASAERATRVDASMRAFDPCAVAGRLVACYEEALGRS